MAIVRFVNGSKDVTVEAIPGTLKKSTTGDDIEEYKDEVGGGTPVLRNGISKEGSVKVIVNEQGTFPAPWPYAQSLVTLLGLHSPTGPEGDYTVYVDGVAHSYHALVQASMDGARVQFVTLEWQGSINS